MAVHDALILETGPGNLTPVLPDPVTVPGRCHDLTNTAPTAAVWGSVGSLPFLMDGVALASLTVPAGTSVRVHSDGVRWVLLRPAGIRRIVAAKGATAADGTVTIPFVPPFATVPVVTNAVETVSTDATECRITALTNASVTFMARRSPAVTVLGISVLSASVPLVGATVHATALEAG
jgi:hypothetical protein